MTLIESAPFSWLRCNRCGWVFYRAAPNEPGASRCRCGVPASRASFSDIGFDETPKGETITPLALAN